MPVNEEARKKAINRVVRAIEKIWNGPRLVRQFPPRVCNQFVNEYFNNPPESLEKRIKKIMNGFVGMKIDEFVLHSIRDRITEVLREKMDRGEYEEAIRNLAVFKCRRYPGQVHVAMKGGPAMGCGCQGGV